MQFQVYKIKDLPGFIENNKPINHDISLTSIRALSQYHNPRADKDDVSLIVCTTDDGNLAGYIGILPEKFYDGTKAGWLSCWWVDKDYGKKAGITLFLMAIKHWNHHFIITDFTPQIKEIVSKTGLFQFTPTTKGIRGYLRFNLSVIIPHKIPALKNTRSLLKGFDTILNLFIDLRLNYFKNRINPNSYTVEQINHFNENDDEFINDHNQTEYFKKSASDVNWILKYPWVIEKAEASPEIITESGAYYFSTIADRFKYINLKIIKTGKTIGLIMMRERDRQFTIPYIFADNSELPGISSIILRFLIEQKATTITIFNSNLRESIIALNPPFLTTRTINKDFSICKEISTLVNSEKVLQDGDGDFVFT